MLSVNVSKRIVQIPPISPSGHNQDISLTKAIMNHLSEFLVLHKLCRGRNSLCLGFDHFKGSGIIKSHDLLFGLFSSKPSPPGAFNVCPALWRDGFGLRDKIHFFSVLQKKVCPTITGPEASIVGIKAMNSLSIGPKLTCTQIDGAISWGCVKSLATGCRHNVSS